MNKKILKPQSERLAACRFFRRRYSAKLLGLATIIAGLSPMDGAADEFATAEKMDDARLSLEKWVETRRVISKERQNWELGKEMLKERIELIQNEIKALREKISDAEKVITKSDKKRVELKNENDALKAASVVFAEKIGSMEMSVKRMLKQMPDPIRERVKPLSQRMPENTEKTKLSLSERFQNVIGIINEINKFNREITLTSEVRKLPDGSSAEVTAIYLGISQAYYANSSGTVAGIGSSDGQEWGWTEADEAAPAINNVIAIMKNEQVASFVQLPVTIH